MKANGKGFNIRNKARVVVAKTCSRTCPETTLAAKRRDKLIGLERKENNSTTIIIGASQIGHPVGSRILKNLTPCLKKPTVSIEINTSEAKAKVTIICPVAAKHLGKAPIKLHARVNRKMLKIRGKNFFPVLSSKVDLAMLNTMECISSSELCILEGTILGLYKASMQYDMQSIAAKTIARLAFVKLKSSGPRWSLKIGKVSN